MIGYSLGGFDKLFSEAFIIIIIDFTRKAPKKTQMCTQSSNNNNNTFFIMLISIIVIIIIIARFVCVFRFLDGLFLRYSSATPQSRPQKIKQTKI